MFQKKEDKNMNTTQTQQQAVKFGGTLRSIADTKVIAAAHDNEQVAELFIDGFESIEYARRLEGMLYGSRVLGNQTKAVEARADFADSWARIQAEYDMTRYGVIEEINNLVGGNIVNMEGTDKQVCMRFYRKFRNVI